MLKILFLLFCVAVFVTVCFLLHHMRLVKWEKGAGLGAFINVVFKSASSDFGETFFKETPEKGKAITTFTDLFRAAVREMDPDEDAILSAGVSGVTVSDRVYNQKGILAATSKRLIFAYENMPGTRLGRYAAIAQKVVDIGNKKPVRTDIRTACFPYQDIKGLEVRQSAMTSGIRFKASGKPVELKQVGGDLREIVRVIEEGMSGMTPRIRI